MSKNPILKTNNFTIINCSIVIIEPSVAKIFMCSADQNQRFYQNL